MAGPIAARPHLPRRRYVVGAERKRTRVKFAVAAALTTAASKERARWIKTMQGRKSARPARVKKGVRAGFSDAAGGGIGSARKVSSTSKVSVAAAQATAASKQIARRWGGVLKGKREEQLEKRVKNDWPPADPKRRSASVRRSDADSLAFARHNTPDKTATHTPRLSGVFCLLTGERGATGARRAGTRLRANRDRKTDGGCVRENARAEQRGKKERTKFAAAA